MALRTRPDAELFNNTFRPSRKWVLQKDGRFTITPANMIPRMYVPYLDCHVGVWEPASSNDVPFSATGEGWGLGSIESTVVPGIMQDPNNPGQFIPGRRLKNVHATSNSIATSITTVTRNEADEWCLSVIIGKGTSDRIAFGIRNMSKGNWVSLCDFRWTRGTVVETHAQSGTSTNRGLMYIDDNTVLLWFSFTSTAPGDGRAVYIYPGYSETGTDSIVYHAQLEKKGFWTTPIVTGDAAGAPYPREGDLPHMRRELFLPWGGLGKTFVGTAICEIVFPFGKRLSSSNMHYSEGTNNNDRIYSYNSTNSATLNMHLIERRANVATFTQGVSDAKNRFDVGRYWIRSDETNSSLEWSVNSAQAKEVHVQADLPASADTIRIAAAGASLAEPMWYKTVYRTKRVLTDREINAMFPIKE